MARSSDLVPQASVRGFVPPQTDAERMLMRHAEDLARTADARGIARYSSFLSDREQALCRAAMNRAGCSCYSFDGGYPEAERRLLCIEPEDSWGERPIACVRIVCRAVASAALPQHKDYLGSLTGLNIRREGLGDIILSDQHPGTAYLFALPAVAQLIADELCEIGRISVSAEVIDPQQMPQITPPQRNYCTATVSSLRLDAVLAAMLKCSRGTAAELIAAGRVEVGHVPAISAGASVYVQDIFTIRGKGRFQLTALPGKSKKDRQIIEYFQY
ncbi:MAG: hypothetical protein IJ347_06205 [Faecalibacterium sp.]|nr:hypothetical protein [Faecalibacterium sp.]